MIKKRINSTSSLKGQKEVAVCQTSLPKKERKPEAHHHHCPIPKIPKKQLHSNRPQQPQTTTQGIKTHKLHELISNFVNSSDRIANLVREEDRSCPYGVYLQDRNKIVQFLDKIFDWQERHRAQSPKSEKKAKKEDYLTKQLETIKLNINKAIHRKKRSKSNGPILTSTYEPKNEQVDELSTMKYLLAQESQKVSALRAQKTELQKEVTSLRGNFAYLQLLTFKSQQLLVQNLIEHEKNAQISLIEKEKVTQVISSLRQTTQYIRSNQPQSEETLASRLKTQAQSLVLYISEMRKKALAILKEKQQSLARFQHQQAQFYELRQKVSRLNGEMGELTEEVDRKDELIQYVKLQNSNLKEELRGMEEMVGQSKKDYQVLADQHYLATERVKMLESQLQSKEEQMSELIVEIQGKNKELIVKLQEIQTKEEDIVALRDQLARLEQSSARVINTLNEEKKLLALQKQRKQNELRETESKVRFLEEEGSILEKKIQCVFNEEEDYKMRISMLEDKVQCLERENLQLYKDLQGLHQEDADCLMQNNKQLQSECKALHIEIAQNRKRIQFYEEQLLQLAKMTDTSHLQRIIQDQRIKIMQFQQHMAPQLITSIPPIPEQNSDQIEANNSPIQSMDALLSAKGKEEENPEGWSRAESKGQEMLQDLIDCIPTFQEHIQRETMSDGSANPHQLMLSREQHSGHSGITALSFYEIHVINEDLNRIDTHTAVSPKKIPTSNTLIPPVHHKALSNNADFQHSQMGNREQSLPSQHQQDNTDSDDENDKLSQASRNVHVGREVEDHQRMIELQEEISKQITPRKPSQVPDLLMSDAGMAESRRKGLSPMKNLHSEQEIKAQMRFSGEIEQKRDKSKIVAGNQKGNILIINNGGKVHRARSCMGQDD